MKKVFYIISVVSLLAAGCSSASSNTSNPQTQKPNPNTKTLVQKPKSIIPSGAESEYEEVLNSISQKCGSQVNLQHVLISLNPKADTRPHTYFFTPGTCGQPDQSLSVIYETTTHSINPSWNMFANKDEILQPIPLQDWKVTYNQALDYALQNGGQDFIKLSPGTTAWVAELDNRKGVKPRWTIRYRNNNNPSAPQLKIFIDPTNGKLLGKE